MTGLLLAVISNVCEKIANAHNDLKHEIINHVTIEKLFEVLPPNIIEKILELGTGPDTKLDVKFQNIKTVLDKQLLNSQEYNLYSDGIRASASSYNFIHQAGRAGTQYRKNNYPKKNSSPLSQPRKELISSRDLVYTLMDQGLDITESANVFKSKVNKFLGTFNGQISTWEKHFWDERLLITLKAVNTYQVRTQHVESEVPKNGGGQKNATPKVGYFSTTPDAVESTTY